MIKKRNISVNSDLKTGFFCKFLLILGIIFLLIYIVQAFLPNFSIEENLAGIILAFSILFIGVGIILFFFHCQFSKLAQIAKEVEQEDLKK
jgi:hypothetical protein